MGSRSKVSRELGVWIAEQLNIDPAEITGIDVHLYSNDTARVDVRMLLRDDDLGGLVSQLKHYELRELSAQPVDQQSPNDVRNFLTGGE